MLVQGDPLRDARVLKEAESLGRAGHPVDVFGSFSAQGRTGAGLPGARSVVPVRPRHSLADRFYRIADRLWPFLPRILPAALLLSALVLVAWLGNRLFGLLPALFLTVSLAIAAMLVGRFALCRLDLRRKLHERLARLRQTRAAARRETHYRELAQAFSDAVSPDSYDAIHCHDLIPLMAGIELKRRCPRLRLVWDAHEFYEDTATGLEPDRRLAQKVISDAAGMIDVFITISDSFRDLYASRYPQLPPALVVMNATRAAGKIHYDGRLHRKTGLDPSRRILLFQGALHPFRGIGAILRAASDLPEPWSVVVMGEGPLGEQVRAEARRLAATAAAGRAPLVWIPPSPHSELPDWSAGASLGIIPYEDKGLNHLYCTPNKLWEFPNAGVPVLASDLEEMGRIIRQHGIGFLLPRRFGPANILAALARIGPDELEVAIASCQNFVKSMSWARFEPELLKAYPS